jgi:hypothetical protein
VRAVFRAMAFASANREETIQVLTNLLKLDREVAARSYELGKRSWSDGGVVSDSAVQTLVDQSLVEPNAKSAVPLDRSAIGLLRNGQGVILGVQREANRRHRGLA